MCARQWEEGCEARASPRYKGGPMIHVSIICLAVIVLAIYRSYRRRARFGIARVIVKASPVRVCFAVVVVW